MHIKKKKKNLHDLLTKTIVFFRRPIERPLIYNYGSSH